MLSLSELSESIAKLAMGDLVASDFVVWFRKASRNVHLSDDKEIRGAISSIENVLSEYHFADLDESGLKDELIDVALSFEPVFADRYGDESFVLVPESYAEAATNVAA